MPQPTESREPQRRPAFEPDADTGEAAVDDNAAKLPKILDALLDDDDGGDAASDDDTGDEQPGDGEEETPKKKPPKTLEALAETLGVEVADLYAVEFKSQSKGAKPRTLGELKDLLGKETDYDRREIEFEERRTRAENELLTGRQDLQFILSQLPKNAVTPELAQRAERERSRVEQLEAQRCIDVVPEWADEEKRKADFKRMGDFMHEYGFRDAELARIKDHRFLKMIRDAQRRSDRIKQALKATEEVKRPAGKAPAKSGQPAERRQRTDVGANPKRKVSAITNLLVNGA